MLFYIIGLVVFADTVEHLGDGACRSPYANVVMGEYTCLGGNSGCSSGDMLSQTDGSIACPGADGELDTDDDGYLRCEETSVSYDNCSETCLDMDTCVAFEVTTNMMTGDGKCELHTVEPTYTAPHICASYDGATFTEFPLGGCRTYDVNDDGNLYGVYNSTYTYNQTDCEDLCAMYEGWCLAMEFTLPLDGDLGKCELHKVAINYTDPVDCYVISTKSQFTGTGIWIGIACLVIACIIVIGLYICNRK